MKVQMSLKFVRKIGIGFCWAVFGTCLAISAASAAGSEPAPGESQPDRDAIATYWRNQLEVQLAPVEIPDPRNPGATLKVFSAEDMVRFMDGTLAELNSWIDHVDPERRPGGNKSNGLGGQLPPMSPDELQLLVGRVEDLMRRMDAVEAKVDALTRGEHKAPFKVLNAGGKVLFSIVEDGTVTVGTEGQAAIVMKTQPSNSAFIQVASGSRRVVVTADSGDGAHVKLNDGADAEVELTTSQGNNGFVRVKGGTSDVIINADPSNAASLNLQNGPDAGVLVSSKPENLGILAQKAGKNALSLGAVPGKGIALRLYNDAGQQVVSAGPNPAKGDNGIVSVGTGDKTAAWLSSEADGAGLAQVFAADGTGAAAMVGKERTVAAYNQAGNAVATISKSDKSEGGTVVARNPGGEGIFAAGFASEYGGGEACVWRAKRSNTFCLGLGLPGMGVGK